jgi:hypothetical protein
MTAACGAWIRQRLSEGAPIDRHGRRRPPGAARAAKRLYCHARSLYHVPSPRWSLPARFSAAKTAAEQSGSAGRMSSQAESPTATPTRRDVNAPLAAAAAAATSQQQQAHSVWLRPRGGGRLPQRPWWCSVGQFGLAADVLADATRKGRNGVATSCIHRRSM